MTKGWSHYPQFQWRDIEGYRRIGQYLTTPKTRQCIQLVLNHHYSDIIIRAMAFQITGISMVCSAVCSYLRKYHRSTSLDFVREIHRWTVDPPKKKASKELKCFYSITSKWQYCAFRSNRHKIGAYWCTILTLFVKDFEPYIFFHNSAYFDELLRT